MNADQERGYNFARGVGRYVGQCFLIGALILGGFALVRNLLDWGTDDSDGGGFHRSGLTIHTDYKTGVQYLGDGHGGLVRRDTK